MKQIILILLIVSLIGFSSAQLGIFGGQSNSNVINLQSANASSGGGGGSGSNVSSVSSGDNCIFVSPTTGDVSITFNTSCGGSAPGDGSFNITYQTFAYNQTSPVFIQALLNNTIGDYGRRVGFNSSYNETYAQFAYNQTRAINPFNQNLNTTNSPSFMGGTFNGQLNSDNPSGLGTWHKYTVLGGFFQIGQITSENGYFQIMGTGFDTYFGNTSLSYFGADTFGQALIGSIRTLKVIMPGGTTLEVNGSRTSINSNNLVFNGTSIDGTNTIAVNLTNANITSQHQTYDVTSSIAFDTSYTNTLGRVIYVDVSFLTDITAGSWAYAELYVGGTRRAIEGPDYRSVGTDLGNVVNYHHMGAYVQPGQVYSINTTNSGVTMNLEEVMITVI